MVQLSLRRKAMFVGGIFLMSLLLLEGSLRIYDKLVAEKEAVQLPQGIRSRGKGRLDYLVLKRNFEGRSPHGIDHKTNNYGFRDDPVDHEKKHVVFLGDSTTFGLNIAHEKTYAEVCESALNEEGLKIQAVNTASPGQGTLEQLKILEEIILPDSVFKIQAVTLGFCCNDFANNMAYEMARQQQSISIKKRLWQSIWGGDESIRGFWPEFQTFLNYGTVTGNKLRAVRRWLSPESWSEKIRAAKKHLTSQGIYIPKPGREVQWSLLDEEALLKNPSYLLTVEALDKISKHCLKNNLPFVFLYMTDRDVEILDDQEEPLYKRCLQKHLQGRPRHHFIDINQIYRNYMEAEGLKEIPAQFYSYQDDLAHPGPLASRLIGQELAKALIKEVN